MRELRPYGCLRLIKEPGAGWMWDMGFMIFMTWENLIKKVQLELNMALVNNI